MCAQQSHVLKRRRVFKQQAGARDVTARVDRKYRKVTLWQARCRGLATVFCNAKCRTRLHPLLNSLPLAAQFNSCTSHCPLGDAAS